MHLDLLSIPQSGGKNVKTFRWFTIGSDSDSLFSVIKSDSLGWIGLAGLVGFCFFELVGLGCG